MRFDDFKTFVIVSINENCAPLRYYAASSGNYVSTFRYNLSVISSRMKNPNSAFGSCGFLNPEGHSFHILCGGSLKLRNFNKW
jgi:hypothetical protein